MKKGDIYKNIFTGVLVVIEKVPKDKDNGWITYYKSMEDRSCRKPFQVFIKTYRKYTTISPKNQVSSYPKKADDSTIDSGEGLCSPSSTRGGRS